MESRVVFAYEAETDQQLSLAVDGTVTVESQTPGGWSCMGYDDTARGLFPSSHVQLVSRVPDNWEELYDGTGARYFCHEVTGRTQWEDPRLPVVDAPVHYGDNASLFTVSSLGCEDDEQSVLSTGSFTTVASGLPNVQVAASIGATLKYVLATKLASHRMGDHDETDGTLSVPLATLHLIEEEEAPALRDGGDRDDGDFVSTVAPWDSVSNFGDDMRCAETSAVTVPAWVLLIARDGSSPRSVKVR